MALETGNYVGDLVATNPPGADPKSQGDDHIRLLKLAIKQTLPGFTGAVMCAGTNGGVVNAYTLTPVPALISYVSPMVALFSPTITNTGATMINISGLGLKNLKSVSGAALVAGELVAGRWYFAIYDGTEFTVDTVTKAYVDQLAFQTALPLQTGNAGKHLTTDGVNASWQDLLGTFVALATVL